MRILVISFFAFISLSVFADTIKIGYINTERVVNEIPQYEQSINEISKEFEPKKQELLNLFNYIELLRSKIKTINKSKEKENLQVELSKLALLEEDFKNETEFWQESMLSLIHI